MREYWLIREIRAAELLDALPEGPDEDERMGDVSQPYVSPAISVNHDPVEAELEAREMGKYLLAKALFDCKEFERCAAVFLPDSVIAGVLSPRDDHDQAVVGTPKGKGKSKGAETPAGALPTLSQRSLFLALYAKFMAGEKQKEEESEMVMGPHDLGTTVNKQLLTIGRFLETWFTQRRSRAAGNTVLAEGSQGWLEYL